MKGKAAGWAVFLLCLLALSFAATTRYSKTADIVLICLRLALVAALSILVVHEKWLHRDASRAKEAKQSAGKGDGILQRFRRWYYDESAQPQ